MTDGSAEGALGAFAELFGLAAPEPEEDRPEPSRRGLFRRLRESIASSQSQAISPQLAGIYQSKMVTDDLWDDLEEALIMAHLGMVKRVEQGAVAVVIVV